MIRALLLAMLAALSAFWAEGAAAQQSKSSPIEFTTSVGSWMSVDVAPDEGWLVFDMVGHIYTLPIDGGNASCLTCSDKRAVNYHPRISPDGRRIAFVSDRGGQDNLWVMNADGSGVRIVHEDLGSRIREPSWSPDGKSIFVSRHFQERHDLRAQIWSFDVETGVGTKVLADRLIYYRAPYKSANGSLYFHTSIPTRNNIGALEGIYIQGIDASGRRSFLRDHPELPADLNESLFIQETLRAERAAERPTRIPVLGDAEFAAIPSRDGRYVAYGRQLKGEASTIAGHVYGPRTALFVKDLRTGQERKILDPITTDLMRFNRSYVDQAIPHFGWSQDSRYIYISIDGNLQRLEISSGQLTKIPFTATVVRETAERVRPRNVIRDTIQTKFAQWATRSPDGSRIAFVAFGKLWIKDAKSAARLALPPSDRLYHTPSWSMDSRWLYFSDAGKEGSGHVSRMDIRSGKVERLTRSPGKYLYPVPVDSKRVLFHTATGANQSGYSAWDLVLLNTETGELRSMGSALPGARPVKMGVEEYSFARIKGFDVEIVRAALGGGEAKPVAILPEAFRTPLAIIPSLSPDGRRLAAEFEQDIYLIDLPEARLEKPRIDVAAAVRDGTALKISRLGGIYPQWRSPNEIEFGSGSRHFSRNLALGTLEDTMLDATAAAPPPERILLLRGAKIVTLHGDVIPKGDVAIRGRRILCVGACGDVAADEIIDVTGKTIMPGLIEIHNHDTTRLTELLLPNEPKMAVNLAYGVTTIHDPYPYVSSRAIFSTAETIAAGNMAGPRIYTSAEPLFGDSVEVKSMKGIEDALAMVKRRQEWGAISTKAYRISARYKQQWIIEASGQLGQIVTAEGGSLQETIGMAIDGQTGWEHPIPQLPIYDDVARFFGEADAIYSPTVSVAGHYKGAAHYFRALSGGAEPDGSEFSFPIVARGLADIVKYGGHGVLGSHGEQPGEGAHWELWAYASVLSPLEAIKTATINGARFLGLELELGSIEPGKLADMIILNSDPLENIRNSIDIFKVMKDGKLYDSYKPSTTAQQ